jgi:hypothetical protein
MILALSGRRIDAPDAELVRFPLDNIERVRQAIRRLFVAQGVSWLVSSAACGADLIALSEAGQLGIRRRIVLPFDRAKFRESSVVDRPGDWGELYDQIVADVGSTGDIVFVEAKDGNDPFRATCQEILNEAAAIGKERRQPVGAVMVWDGNVRETPDYTSEFGADAKARGMTVVEISTV